MSDQPDLSALRAQAKEYVLGFKEHVHIEVAEDAYVAGSLAGRAEEQVKVAALETRLARWFEVSEPLYMQVDPTDHDGVQAFNEMIELENPANRAALDTIKGGADGR